MMSRTISFLPCPQPVTSRPGCSEASLLISIMLSHSSQSLPFRMSISSWGLSDPNVSLATAQL